MRLHHDDLGGGTGEPVARHMRERARVAPPAARDDDRYLVALAAGAEIRSPPVCDGGVAAAGVGNVRRRIGAARRERPPELKCVAFAAQQSRHALLDKHIDFAREVERLDKLIRHHLNPPSRVVVSRPTAPSFYCTAHIALMQSAAAMLAAAGARASAIV